MELEGSGEKSAVVVRGRIGGGLGGSLFVKWGHFAAAHDESIPQGLKPDAELILERPKAEALGVPLSDETNQAPSGLLVGGAHEDQCALGEGGVDEESGAGEGYAEVDVGWRSRKGERDEARSSGSSRGQRRRKLGPRSGGRGRAKSMVSVRTGQGDKHRRGDDDPCEGDGGERGTGHEEGVDLWQVGEGSDVEAEVQQLQQRKRGCGRGCAR